MKSVFKYIINEQERLEDIQCEEELEEIERMEKEEKEKAEA